MKQILTIAIAIIFLSVAVKAQVVIPININGGGGGVTIDTTALRADINANTSSITSKLNKSDTASMLSAYQTAINNRATLSALALKLGLSDTAAMLAGYATSLGTKLNVNGNSLTAGWRIGSTNNTSFRIQAAGVERMKIDSANGQLYLTPATITVASKNKYKAVWIGGKTMFVQIDSTWNGSAYQTGAASTAVGENAMSASTSRDAAAFGVGAMQNSLGGTYSAAFGNYSLFSSTGLFGTGFGYGSGYGNNGSGNNYFGYNSGFDPLGTYNSYFGMFSGTYSRGSFNVGMGDKVLQNNISDNSVGIGKNALINNTWPGRVAIGTDGGNDFTAGLVKSFASANVSGTTITITSHGFGSTGAKINLKYNLISGTTVGGLVDGTIYMFTIASANTLTLSTISGAGSGTYTLTRDADKTNSIAIGKDAVNTKDYQTVIGTPFTKENMIYGVLGYRKVIAEGDSFFNDSDDIPYYLKDSSAYFGKAGVVNYAVAGETTTQMRSEYATEGHASRPTLSGDDYWFMMYGGINDLLGSITADSIYKNLKYIWAQARADGYRTIGFTVINSLALSGPQEAQRVILNDSILSNPNLVDYVIDVEKQFNPSIDPGNFYDATHLSVGARRMFAGIVCNTIEFSPFRLTPAGVITSSPNDFYPTFKNAMGFAPMTKAQRDLLPSKFKGMAIFQTDNTPGLRVYNGTNWIKYSESTD